MIDLTPPSNGSFWVNRTIKIGDTTILYSVQDPVEGSMIHISSIRTPLAKRNAGGARLAMLSFLKSSDAINKPVNLDCSALDKKTSTSKLFTFYQSLGFVPTGKIINLVGDQEMIRTVP